MTIQMNVCWHSDAYPVKAIMNHIFLRKYDREIHDEMVAHAVDFCMKIWVIFKLELQQWINQTPPIW